VGTHFTRGSEIIIEMICKSCVTTATAGAIEMVASVLICKKERRVTMTVL